MLLANITSGRTYTGETKPVVVASIRPLALLVEDLAGDLVSTEVLVQAQTSPHDFSLTIAQMMRLTEAQLLVWVGPQFETYLNKDFQVATLAMDDSTLTSEPHDHHSHANPHIWLDVAKVMRFAKILVPRLTELRPDAAALFTARLASFEQEIKDSDTALQAKLAPYREIPFIVFHDGYAEFVERYGLRQQASLTAVPHEQVGAKRLNALIREADGAACLLAETSEAPLARRYANLLDLPLVEVDLLASHESLSSYASYLMAIGERFLTCLAGKKNPARAGSQ